MVIDIRKKPSRRGTWDRTQKWLVFYTALSGSELLGSSYPSGDQHNLGAIPVIPGAGLSENPPHQYPMCPYKSLRKYSSSCLTGWWIAHLSTMWFSNYTHAIWGKLNMGDFLRHQRLPLKARCVVKVHWQMCIWISEHIFYRNNIEYKDKYIQLYYVAEMQLIKILESNTISNYHKE